MKINDYQGRVREEVRERERDKHKAKVTEMEDLWIFTYV